MLILAFGFGNLAMLGWLAAAAAPLLIHLWSRHRFRETTWAAMDFLLAAMRKNARRLQLQQWLLLAVRTAIILLVVLAVAEPYGERLVAGGGAATHHVLVLDGSYSMAYRDGEASNFARAKQLAAAMVRESRSADTFTVIRMAAPARTIVGPEVADHRRVAAEIEALAQTHATADLAGALTLVQEALAAKTPPRRPAERQAVYFVTDMQRAAWEPSLTSLDGGSELIAELAQQATLTVIDLGRPQADNLAITSLTTPDPFVTVGREATFEVALQHFGPHAQPQHVVELLIDSEPVAEQTVEVPASGHTTLQFTHRFASPGQHAVAVRTTGDNLDVDNQRWLSVPVVDEIRVLCVAGGDGAAAYVAQALAPDRAGRSAIRPVVVSEGEMADVELTDFAAVFLCNVGRLTGGEAERLRRYASGGGGVVFFLGDQVVPGSYNAHAPGSLRPPDQPLLLPARLAGRAVEPQFGIDPLDYVHPIIAPFRGRERAGLLTTPVGHYYRLDVSGSGPETDVAAALPDGDPFIVAAPLGLGRIVMVATDGSLASIDAATGQPWTHWPTWPSFLPIVRELLAYAAAGERQQLAQLVGTPIDSHSATAANTLRTPATVRIVRPDGGAAAVAAQSPEWSYRDTELSGIYTVDLHDGEPRAVAVNIDPSESDLAKLDPSLLPPDLQVRETWQRPARDPQWHSTRAGWNMPLLWAVLGLLFGESFLAWWFGRGVI